MTYTIDGKAFSTLQGFFDEISRAVIPGAEWGHNLDAFNDILRGGFGTPEGGSSLYGKTMQFRAIVWAMVRPSVSWR